jgi:tetratricopeptide (TPR) repeat protein
VTLERRQKLIISLGLIAATIVAYEPIRYNGFVNYDDGAYITNNPNVTAGLTPQSVAWAFTKSYSGNWHPLTWLSHILDCQIFGLNPPGHHLVSLLYHIINALLLFWLLKYMTGSVWASAFAAAVFALHPLQVESVAWAAERKTVLSGLFWLLTIAAYIRYTKKPGLARYISLLVVFGLCMMTKPVVVTLPLVLLLLDYWPLERVKRRYPPAGKTVTMGWLFIEKIPLLALSAILSATTFLVQRHWGAVVAIEKMPFDIRFANAFISYIKYIGKVIWPGGLAAFYPHPRANIPYATAAVCMLVFALLTIFCIYLGRRRKYLATGWLWFAGTLVPMLGLIQVGMQSMADRYMYLPIVGLLFIIAWSVRDFVINHPRWKVAFAALAGVIILAAIILTRAQAGYWRNSMTLFEHALKVTKNNDVAEKGYGSALFEAGRLDEAVVHLSNALRIQPGYFAAGNDLGKVYLKQGKLNEAVSCFNELLKRKKNPPELYYNLGLALSMQKKYDEAAKFLAKTLEMDPKYPDASNRMGTVLLAAGKNTEAIKHLNVALRITPNEPGIYEKLGNAYAQSGDYDQAIRNWSKAVELKPNNAETLNNLAWLLATAENTSAQDANQAIGLARRACELTKDEKADRLDTLAAAYAAAGRFEEAVKTAKQAVDMAKAEGKEEQVGEIQNRMELYKAGQKYLQK